MGMAAPEQPAGRVGVARGPRGPVAARPVTQAELEKYVRLQEAERQREAARLDLVTRLEAGAAVEPGALRAWIERPTQRRLTFAAIERACGAAEAERLRGLVEPTCVPHLYVRPA